MAQERLALGPAPGRGSAGARGGGARRGPGWRALTTWKASSTAVASSSWSSVINGVLAALERFEGGDLDPGAKVLATPGQPAAGLARAAGHQTQPPVPHDAVSARGQIDHPGQVLGARTTTLQRQLTHVVPHLLVHTQTLHTGQPRPTGSQSSPITTSTGSSDRPQRAPRRAQPPGHARHRGLPATDLVDRPPARPHRQQRTRPGHPLVLLSKHTRRAPRPSTPPGPRAPHQPHRPAQARRVDKHHLTAPMAATTPHRTQPTNERAGSTPTTSTPAPSPTSPPLTPQPRPHRHAAHPHHNSKEPGFRGI